MSLEVNFPFLVICADNLEKAFNIIYVHHIHAQIQNIVHNGNLYNEKQNIYTCLKTV